MEKILFSPLPPHVYWSWAEVLQHEFQYRRISLTLRNKIKERGRNFLLPLDNNFSCMILLTHFLLKCLATGKKTCFCRRPPEAGSGWQQGWAWCQAARWTPLQQEERGTVGTKGEEAVTWSLSQTAVAGDGNRKQGGLGDSFLQTHWRACSVSPSIYSLQTDCRE